MTASSTIHIRHIREARLCMSGAREWFASHDLSWNDFLENGIPCEVVEQIDDHFGKIVSEIARKDGE
jgi:hypothetical protein